MTVKSRKSRTYYESNPVILQKEQKVCLEEEHFHAEHILKFIPLNHLMKNCVKMNNFDNDIEK